MSDPFVYTPQRVDYHNSPYLAPFLNQQYSPFIPQMNLSGSPFVSNAALPDSPQYTSSSLPPNSPFIPSDIPFPQDDPDPVNPWSSNQRRLSWNGGLVPPYQNGAWLQPRPPRRQRTRSDSGYFDQQPQVVNINNGYWVSPGSTPYGGYAQLPPVAPQAVALHPYLDAQLRRGDVLFDLSSPQFCPMRMMAHGQGVVLTAQELGEVATHPPMYTMKIVCDLIPNWPIDIAWNSSTSHHSNVPVPIKLGDVLNAIWNTMQRRISQQLWAGLNPQQVHAISMAYTARYRATRGYETAIARDGVKKVDFLHGKKWFKGLARTADGVEILKMQVI